MRISSDNVAALLCQRYVESKELNYIIVRSFSSRVQPVMYFALFPYLCITYVFLILFLKFNIDDKHICGFIDVCSAPNWIDNV